MKPLQVEFTDEQRQGIHRLAAAMGMGDSTWVRQQVCNSLTAHGIDLTGRHPDTFSRPIPKSPEWESQSSGEHHIKRPTATKKGAQP